MKWLVCLLVFLITPFIASAEIKINEFSSGSSSSDWVELYNDSTESASLSMYLVRDSSETNKYPLSEEISGGGFVTISVSNRLDNDGDIVKLFRVEGAAEILLEEIPYGDKGGICAPSAVQTIGRLPDGGVNIVRFSQATKAASNTSPIDACPAPTVLPTSGPTNTPAPSATPVSTSSPVPSNTPKPSATPKATPTSVVLPSPDDSDGQTSQQAQLLKLDDSGPPTTPVVLGDSVEKKSSVVPIILIVIGVVGLGISLVVLYRHTRQIDILS